MKFLELFDWENRPLCRRIGIFIIDFKPANNVGE